LLRSLEPAEPPHDRVRKSLQGLALNLPQDGADSWVKACRGRFRRYRRKMARVPRSSLPDGFFHVSARGVDRTTPLFQDGADRTAFLRFLHHAVDDHGLTCHAICVMSTHYHLVVEATRAQLSKALQFLNCAYATHFNRRYERYGHVFAGRFSARAIVSETYLREACSYVLANPVRAGLCDRAEDWPWSYSRYGAS
jgi:putative transposase